MKNLLPVKSEKYKKDSILLREAFELAVKEIIEVLSKKKDLTDITKLATITIATYSRLKSTEVHEKALTFIERRLQIEEKNKY